MKAKKFLGVFLSMVMILSIVLVETIPTSAATISFKETVTGRVTGSYGSPCNVYTNGKAAKLRICTFNQNGKRTSGKITVMAQSDNGGKWVWKVKGCNSWMSNSTNITLPKGNTHYTIRIMRNGNSN